MTDAGAGAAMTYTAAELRAVLRWLTAKIIEMGVSSDIRFEDFLKLPEEQRIVGSYLHGWRGEVTQQLAALPDDSSGGAGSGGEGGE